MKILQVNCVYRTGSTGKIVECLHQGLLEHGFESAICYGRGDLVNEANVYKTSSEVYAKLNNGISRLTGIMYGGCVWSTNRLISIIGKEKPDIVHLHCINGNFVNIYRIVEWLKRSQIPTVLTMHAEFMYTSNCGYALDCDRWLTGCGKCPRLKKETKSILFDRTAVSFRKMKKAFQNFQETLKVVSVSPWLMERAERSPILKNKDHICILNGIDTDVFCRYAEDDVKRRFCPNGEKLVFHATAHFSDETDDLKGGIWLLRLAERMKDQDIRFVVAGTHRLSHSVPDNVILLGKVSDQMELARLYNAADLTILVSKKETFSMIVAESLCCGTPVVGFQAGAPEQIAIPEYSRFVEQGDLDTLEHEVLSWLNHLPDKQTVADQGKTRYSSQTMLENYLRVYRRIYETEQNRNMDS